TAGKLYRGASAMMRSRWTCVLTSRRQEQAAVRCPRKRPDGALNVRGVLDQAGHNLDPERRRQGLRCTQVVIIKGRGLGVGHEGGALKTRSDLLDHPEPLAPYPPLHP